MLDVLSLGYIRDSDRKEKAYCGKGRGEKDGGDHGYHTHGGAVSSGHDCHSLLVLGDHLQGGVVLHAQGVVFLSYQAIDLTPCLSELLLRKGSSYQGCPYRLNLNLASLGQILDPGECGLQGAPEEATFGAKPMFSLLDPVPAIFRIRLQDPLVDDVEAVEHRDMHFAYKLDIGQFRTHAGQVRRDLVEIHAVIPTLAGLFVAKTPATGFARMPYRPDSGLVFDFDDFLVAVPDLASGRVDSERDQMHRQHHGECDAILPRKDFVGECYDFRLA